MRPTRSHRSMFGGRLALAAVFVAGGLVACQESSATPDPDLTFEVGTEEDRAALFDFLVESTMEWDAFATLPDHPIVRTHPAGLDVPAEMARYRDDLLAADTDSAFYYALLKISNARKDRHLRLGPVEGGLQFPDTFGIEESQANAPVADSPVPSAPVILRTDYGDADRRTLFVGDLSEAVAAGAYGPAPAPGDRVVAIQGRPVAEFAEAVRPYHRYSTDDSFWWWFPYWATRRTVQIPARYYGDALELTLEADDGAEYEVALPYYAPDEIEWVGHSDRIYPGLSHAPEFFENETFDLFLPDDEGLRVVILQWHGFRRDLPEAIDALLELAGERDLLDAHVIVDATRGAGGSRGSYAVARLQPERHKGSFGNLMVSEVMERWVEERIDGIRSGRVNPATEDDGSWKLEWLEGDVQRAIQEGRAYTNAVPFKGAHAPPWSDGFIDPAPVHFTGGLTVWLGPKGGSHLDQFAAQVSDNQLGHIIGMPAGGYSNTWQATETLRFPTNGRPIVSYQWSMGHSIRPNGQILQYNPAQPDEPFPQTRENYLDYHAQLLDLTLERIQGDR